MVQQYACKNPFSYIHTFQTKQAHLISSHLYMGTELYNCEPCTDCYQQYYLSSHTNSIAVLEIVLTYSKRCRFIACVLCDPILSLNSNISYVFESEQEERRIKMNYTKGQKENRTLNVQAKTSLGQDVLSRTYCLVQDVLARTSCTRFLAKDIVSWTRRLGQDMTSW